MEIETANIASAAAYIAEQLASENKAFLGGAATGAAIGTAIMPGIGTILGVLGGLFAGAAMAPDTIVAAVAQKTRLNTKLDQGKSAQLVKIVRSGTPIRPNR